MGISGEQHEALIKDVPKIRLDSEDLGKRKSGVGDRSTTLSSGISCPEWSWQWARQGWRAYNHHGKSTWTLRKIEMQGWAAFETKDASRISEHEKMDVIRNFRGALAQRTCIDWSEIAHENGLSDTKTMINLWSKESVWPVG